MIDPQLFRDRLLAVGTRSPEVQEQLHKEIHEMLIKELNWPRRIALSLLSVFALGSAAVCGALAATEPNLPTAARVGLGTGTLFGLCWFATFVVILRRGALDLRRDSRRMAQMVWVFTLLMVIFFVVLGMTARDSARGLLMIAQSLVFLIAAAVYWLTFRIEESELNVKERLLRLELQLSELAAK